MDILAEVPVMEADFGTERENAKSAIKIKSLFIESRQHDKRTAKWKDKFAKSTQLRS